MKNPEDHQVFCEMHWKEYAKQMLDREEKQRRHRLIQRVLVIIGALCTAGAVGYAVALGIGS